MKQRIQADEFFSFLRPFGGDAPLGGVEVRPCLALVRGGQASFERVDVGQWEQIDRLIRGCNPAPGAWTLLDGNPTNNYLHRHMTFNPGGILNGAVNGVGWVVRETSLGFRKLQTGLVRNYALGIVLGTAALLTYLLLWAAR